MKAYVDASRRGQRYAYQTMLHQKYGPVVALTRPGMYVCRCVSVFMYTCMHASMYVCMYVFMYLCMFVGMYVCMYACMSVFMF